MDISTFSKASKNRDPVIFHNLFSRLRSELNKKKNIDPRASSIISNRFDDYILD